MNDKAFTLSGSEPVLPIFKKLHDTIENNTREQTVKQVIEIINKKQEYIFKFCFDGEQWLDEVEDEIRKRFLEKENE